MKQKSRAVEDMTDEELGFGKNNNDFGNFGDEFGIIRESDEEDVDDEDDEDEDEEDDIDYLYTFNSKYIGYIIANWTREYPSLSGALAPPQYSGNNNNNKNENKENSEDNKNEEENEANWHILPLSIVYTISDLLCKLKCSNIFLMGTYQNNLITSMDVFNYHGIVNKYVKKGSKMYDEVIESIKKRNGIESNNKKNKKDKNKGKSQQLTKAEIEKTDKLVTMLDDKLEENLHFNHVFLTADQLQAAGIELREAIEELGEHLEDPLAREFIKCYKWTLDGTGVKQEQTDEKADNKNKEKEKDKEKDKGTSTNDKNVSGNDNDNNNNKDDNDGKGDDWGNEIKRDSDDDSENGWEDDSIEVEANNLFNRKGICNVLCKDVNYKFINDVSLYSIELPMSKRLKKIHSKRLDNFMSTMGDDDSIANVDSPMTGTTPAPDSTDIDTRFFEYSLYHGWQSRYGTGLLQCGGYYDMNNIPSICQNVEFWCFETRELFFLPEMTRPRVDCSSMFIENLGFIIIGGQEFADFKKFTTKALASIEFLPVKSVFDHKIASLNNDKNKNKYSFGKWLVDIIPNMNEARSSIPSIGLNTGNSNLETQLFVGSGFNSNKTIEYIDLNYLYSNEFVTNNNSSSMSSSGMLNRNKSVNMTEDDQPKFKLLNSKLIDGHTHGSNLLINNKVNDNMYIAGGIGDDNGGQSCEYVNLVKDNQFVKLPSMNRSHAKKPLLRLGECNPNLLYCIGGDITKRDDYIEYYDVRTNDKEWTLVSSLHTWNAKGPSWTQWKQVV